MRRAVVAAAVTTGVVAAAASRRPRRVGKAAMAIPAQRDKTELEKLVEGDAELVMAEQDAQDDHILEALDQLLRRTG